MTADEQAATVRARLQRGYHEGGHHPRCATRTANGCDCYARESAAAIAALDVLVARCEEAERERDELRRESRIVLRERAEAAERRVAQLETALREIQEANLGVSASRANKIARLARAALEGDAS